MSVESDIYTLMKPLAGNRVFPDVAPLGTATPFITYQQVGGDALSFYGREVPSKKHGRFQVNVWGKTRAEVAALSLQIESAFITATAFTAEALGAPVSELDEEIPLYGARQDFSIWSER